jgi:hypothetical protein
MVTMCFVAKSPNPDACVVGLGQIGIDRSAFEAEVLPLVALPNGFLPMGGLERNDSFDLVARRRIKRQTWTWMGRYRHALDSEGRENAFAAAGILMLNQVCPGDAAADLINRLDGFLFSNVLHKMRPPPDWKSLTLPTDLLQLSHRADDVVGQLQPEGGLSAENSRLRFHPKPNLSRDELAQFLAGAQDSPNLKAYGRLMFNASASLAQRLGAMSDIETHGRAAIPEVVTTSASDPPPRPAAPPDTMSDSRPAMFDYPIGSGRGPFSSLATKEDIANLRKLVESNHRAVRQHWRVIWMGIALLAAALVFYVGVATNGVANVVRSLRDRDIAVLSADFAALTAHIDAIKSDLQKPPPNPKAPQKTSRGGSNPPAPTKTNADDKDKGKNKKTRPVPHRDRHANAAANATNTSGDPTVPTVTGKPEGEGKANEGGGGVAAPNAPSPHPQADSREMVPDKTCQDPSKALDPADLPICSRAVLRKYHRRV